MQATVCNPVSLEESHAYCHRQTKRNARSFYFASYTLPPEKKRAAYAVYSFCRHVDDLVDRTILQDDHEAALEQVSIEFDQITEGKSQRLPFAPAFAWAVKHYCIEKQLFLDLLKGMKIDLGTVRIADWSELYNYCYYVASVVGLMMVRILELNDEKGRQHAIELGIAMQLTNIIRDIGEDYRMNRIYLPLDEMQRHGVTESDFASTTISEGLRALLRENIARARDYYRCAEIGIPLLSDDGSQFTTWLMRHVYAGILDEVERMNYQVLQRRAATTFPRKLVLAGRAWRAYRRTRAH